MAALLDPMPFWQALSYLEGKEAVASAMTTAEWQRIPVAVRVPRFLVRDVQGKNAVRDGIDPPFPPLLFRHGEIVLQGHCRGQDFQEGKFQFVRERVRQFLRVKKFVHFGKFGTG